MAANTTSIHAKLQPTIEKARRSQNESAMAAL